MEGVDLSNLDLRNINFKCANLRRCNLSNCDLTNCIFERADLSRSKLDVRIIDSILIQCIHFNQNSGILSLSLCNIQIINYYGSCVCIILLICTYYTLQCMHSGTVLSNVQLYVVRSP